MRGSELMSNWFMSGRVVMALFGVAGALVLGCAANLAVCAAGSSAAACRSLAAGQAVVAQEVGFDTVRARRSAGENFDRACYAGDGDACEEAIAYWSSLRILSGLESGACSIDGLRGSGNNGRSGARCLQEFPVQVESGHSYTFSTAGASSGDTFLRVSGACNCSNDDARNSVASECECRATQTGLATICASTYSGNSASWDYSVRSSDGGGCAGGDTPGQVAARGSQVIVDPTEDPVGYRVRAHLASLRFAAVDSRVRTQSVPQALQELYTFHDQFPEFALEEPLVYRLSLELLEPAVARRYVDSYPNGAHVAEMQRRWLEQETAALVARPCSSETETRLVTIWRDAGHGNTPIETRDRAAQRTLECLSDGQLRGQRSEWLQIVARVFVGAPGATRAIDELEQMRVQEARRQESERADQEAAEEREEAADRAANQRAANARQAAASAALAQCMARCRADRAVCARVCQNYR